MKAYLVSFLLVGLALGGMGLGTFAWFTDQETVENNVIATGNVDLKAWTEDCWGRVAPLNVDNLVPSKNTWTPAGDIKLQNDGTVPLKWKAYLVKTGGDLPTDDKLEFKFKKTSWLNSAPGEAAADIEAADAELDSLFPGASKVYTWSQISNAETTELNSDNFGGAMNDINPFTRTLSVHVKLDENAGNVYSNKDVTFKVIFIATQTDNPGWAQTSPAV